jgi:hypothetical protein
VRKVITIEGFTSNKIKVVLAEHHNKDVFVTECKNGSTWFTHNLLKLDAWVLKRTYSPPTTIGYEIKVDRQDFEQDQKWIDYLPYCHEFYFACPAGLVRSDELPPNVGLVWVSSTGKPHTKHKAEHHEPDAKKLNDLMTYILMSRSIIVADMYAANGTVQNEDRLVTLRKITEKANEKKELGDFIKGHVRKMQEFYREENSKLKTREDIIKRFSDDLARIGITWNPEIHDWQDTSRVENEIRLLKNQINNDLLYQMKATGQKLIDVATEINGYRNKETK